MSRRMTILCIGTRGDTQPCAALGQELRSRGHHVVLAASHRYHDLVAGAGIEHFGLDFDAHDLLTTAKTSGRHASRELKPKIRRLLTQVNQACQGSDLILSPPFGLVGYHMAERLGVPCVLMHFQPNHPTGAFMHPMAGGRSVGPVLNRMSYVAVKLSSWLAVRSMINGWRVEQLGLPPIPVRGLPEGRLPVVVGYSPAMVPTPQDWGPAVQPTGYWFLPPDSTWQPPPGLTEFLDAGEPPICVGFGAMTDTVDQGAIFRTVRSTVDKLRRRAVLVGVSGDSDDRVHLVGDVPHDWLFSRVSAVVHHGGAGTTAAAVRAGVPSVICPFFYDQPFWGRRIAELGAGPAPVPFKALTADRLTAALDQTLRSSSIHAAAKRLGRRINGENGAATAADRLAGLL